MILHARCAGCEQPGPPLCRSCRLAVVGSARVGARHHLMGPGGTLVAMRFVGRARTVLLGYKYRNRRAMAAHLAGLLVNRILAAGLRPGIDFDIITWAPTSAERRRTRGYDQAELIARRLGAVLQVHSRGLLERTGDSTPQTGRSRSQRIERFTGRRQLRVSPRAAGRRVLVVDDIITTGATLAAARRSLEEGGARRVITVAVAATPDAIEVRQPVVPAARKSA